MLFRLASCLLLASPALSSAASQDAQRYERAPIHYAEAALDGPFERWLAEFEAGNAGLAVDERLGLLPALLEALEIPLSSQTLVFSKTSQQIDFISPANPRAIYFADDVYVGWIPGAPTIEISSMDPHKGPVFYTVRNAPGPVQDATPDLGQRSRPAIQRDQGQCLACHGGPRTDHWPGNLLRSVHVDEKGQILPRLGGYQVVASTPMEQRWGGWYVTGTHGDLRHLGNQTSAGEGLNLDAGANLRSLEGLVATRRYASPHSDLVALMVLAHQVEMHNILARASYEVRLALQRDRDMRQLLGEHGDGLRAQTRRIVQKQASLVVDGLLFRHEAPLGSPIRGSSSFASDFPARGRRDAQGRSLKDLHLGTRLMQYPCSFLIDSPAFDALPAPLLDSVYAKLFQVLNGAPAFDDHIRLSLPTRRAILGILRETKPTLPASWR